MVEALKEASAFNATESEATSLDDVDYRKEVIDSRAIDPVLAKKMGLINAAIDEIGMTPYQWKLFCLNGFGYAVDSVRKPEQQHEQLVDTLTLAATHRLPIHCTASSFAAI